MRKITPFLWFDTQAEDAMKSYVSIFRNSRVVPTALPGLINDQGPSQLIGFGPAVLRNRLGGRAPHSVLR